MGVRVDMGGRADLHVVLVEQIRRHDTEAVGSGEEAARTGEGVVGLLDLDHRCRCALVAGVAIGVVLHGEALEDLLQLDLRDVGPDAEDLEGIEALVHDGVCPDEEDEISENGPADDEGDDAPGNADALAGLVFCGTRTRFSFRTSGY